MNSRTRRYTLLIFTVLGLTLLFILLAFAASDTTIASASSRYLPVQDDTDINVISGALDRLSWGAVIAGSLITLILMFMLNLVGIAAGLTQINPDYGQDSMEANTLAGMSVVWIIVSNLIALIIGGGLAAYFSGIPDPLDGVLHGIMVWAVSGLVTAIFVISQVGYIFSGLASLINSGFRVAGTVGSELGRVAGDAVQTATSGVGRVAGSALQTAAAGIAGAGHAAGSALQNASSGVEHAASTAADKANKSLGNGNSGQMSSRTSQGYAYPGGTVENRTAHLTDSAIENSPDVQYALQYQDLRFDEILMEIKQLIRDAGKDPDQIQQQAKAAAKGVEDAAQQAVRHPEQADEMLNLALQRVLRRGQAVASDVDRQALVNVLTERTDMSEEEVKQRIQEWEQRFKKVKQQTQEARQTARQKAEELVTQAEAKAQELYEQAESRAQELQQEAEERARELQAEAEEKSREAAQAATDTFAKIAASIALAMLLGAVAAGLGGYVGAPQLVVDDTIDEETSISLILEEF